MNKTSLSSESSLNNLPSFQPQTGSLITYASLSSSFPRLHRTSDHLNFGLKNNTWPFCSTTAFSSYQNHLAHLNINESFSTQNPQNLNISNSSLNTDHSTPKKSFCTKKALKGTKNLLNFVFSKKCLLAPVAGLSVFLRELIGAIQAFVVLPLHLEALITKSKMSKRIKHPLKAVLFLPKVTSIIVSVILILPRVVVQELFGWPAQIYFNKALGRTGRVPGLFTNGGPLDILGSERCS